MISGITDQGEGNSISNIIREAIGQPQMVQAVKDQYQASKANLEVDYPSYDSEGNKVPSADAAARGDSPNVHMDHFEVFTAVKALYDAKKLVTWDQWHAAGNEWSPEMLKTADYNKNTYDLPSAEDISGALNRLKNDDANESNYKIMCQAAAGAIKGITTVLNDYWAEADEMFPFPSMAGSGDRMSICWAVFGKMPDLKYGTPQKKQAMYHACQGMGLDKDLPNDPDSCALVAVYHTCKGSNGCKGEGGCGFVQKVGGGSNCSSTTSFQRSGLQKGLGDGCAPIFYSAPSDNKCGGQGGCAVPISASQLYPDPGKKSSDLDTQAMQIFNIAGDNSTLGYFPYDEGDSPYKEGAAVYDIAWKAYIKVLEANGEPVPEKPKPSDFRLAFPPST